MRIRVPWRGWRVSDPSVLGDILIVVIGVVFPTVLVWPIGVGVAVWYLTSIRHRLSSSVDG